MPTAGDTCDIAESALENRKVRAVRATRRSAIPVRGRNSGGAAATSGQVSDDGGKLTAGLPKPIE